MLASVGAWARCTVHPRTASPEGLGVQFPPCITANLAASPSRLRQDFPAAHLPASCFLFPLELPGLSPRKVPEMPSPCSGHR